MAITDLEAQVLDFIKDAVLADRAALVETEDQSGNRVVVLANIYNAGDEYEIAPLARLFSGDPMPMLRDPTELLEG